MKHGFLKAFSAIAVAVLSIASLAITVSAEKSEDEFEINITSSVRADVSDNQYTLSNDDLLLGYLSSELCNTKPTHALGPRNLTGDALDIYNYVYDEIEKAANGNLSSTVIRYPNDIVWTYSELGFTNGYDSEILSDKIGEVFRSVHNYLLFDLPYTFYWYDKTKGVSLVYDDIIGSNQNETITIKGFGFKFVPASDYKGSSDFTLDTSLTKTASSVSSTAASIVQEHAGKDDIAKLTAYKEEICELVEYNQAAADSNDTSSVGINPWQLIYVFDGDSSTNVVCEGYSKAFQYLCNLSSFNENVYCYTASGDMIFGGSSGPHMWNIVTINKVNYLIDVTNCDGNSVGAPDQLFLKGFSGSIENGYSRELKSGTVLYTYGNEIKAYYNPNILRLCPDDYDPDNEPDPDYDENDTPIGNVDSADYVVWAGGGKNYKTITITSSLTASNWTDAKGKTKKGKLAWVSSANNETPSFDSVKHKLTTKSDKTIATVSNKGKVTAKSGGANGEQTAYIYATDSGSMTSTLYKVTVKNAPNTILCFDSADKTDKKDKLKAVNTYSGAAATKVYILPTSKLGAVSDDCTYTVTAKKNNNVITISDVKTDSNARLYFEITPIKPEKEGKVSKITVTVACDQSGKKSSFKVNVGAPVASITATTTSTAIKTKKSTAEIKLDLTVSGTATTTTDKLQVFVSTTAPVLDSTGKKLTVTKSKQITAKLNKNGTITLKASKDVTEAASVYLVATDASLKTKTVFTLLDIAADGTISSPKASE